MDFSIQVTDHIAVAFGTPLLTALMPDAEAVNPGLRRQIMAEMERDTGVRVSNRGGWQSAPVLWSWTSPEIEALKALIHQGLLRMAALPSQETDLSAVDLTYQAGAWANVNRHGTYNDGHIHPDCDWACVYYVATGEPEDGWERNGKFELHDPRTLARTSTLEKFGFGRNLVIDPEPGKLILFPAWMVHSVHPFYGAGERISIAANIKIRGGAHAGFR